MRPLRVVIVDPALESLPDLAGRLKSMQVNALVLQGAPEPFDHHVIHPAPLAVHGDANPSILEDGDESVAGELASLIGVENLGCTVTLQRLFQGGNAKFGIQGIRQPPGQNLAAGPVHDRHQIKEAAPHRNVANVGAPNLIGSVDDHAAQQVRINLVPGMRP